MVEQISANGKSAEEISGKSPEINYYGIEVDELLASGTKIVTLRKPAEKYNLAPGTRFNANCVDTGAVVPSIVIANTERPLNEFPDFTLLLDGYANSQIAADDLANYYGHVDVDTPMQRIATLPVSFWDALSGEGQKLMLESGLEEAMREPAFRHIFMPALLKWHRTYKGSSIENWHNWLVSQGLVTREEIDAKIAVDPDTEYFYLDTLATTGGVEWVLGLDPSDPAYRNLILHEAISVPFDA